MLDQYVDLAYSTLAAGIAAGATSMSLTSGGGARFTQTRAFTGTIWNTTDYAAPELDPNREEVRVTAGFGTDTYTITRGQGNTADVAHNTAGKTYGFMQAVTSKFFNTDLFTIPSHYGLLPGARVVGVFSANMGTGVIDVYTCPAGKRAIVITNPLVFNTTASTSITYSTGVKLAGTTYQRLTADTSVGGGNASTVSVTPFVLEPGEIYSVTTNGTGLNFAATVIEFDSSFPLYTARLSGLAAGDNLLYTCPAGKSAVPIGASTWGFGFMILVPTLAITYYPEIVPTGQTPGVAFEMASSIPATAGIPVNKTVLAINAGDRYYMNSNSATTSFLFVTVLELPTS